MDDTTTLLRFATAGSVDDGKSTLVGRLLHDSKSVLADQLEAVERVSQDRGQDAPDLALLTDGLRAEREQGITIDVAYRYFATARRRFILADGSAISRQLGDVSFRLSGQRGASPVIFGEKGDSVLLGAVSLEALGMVLDPMKRELRPLPMVLAGKSRSRR